MYQLEEKIWFWAFIIIPVMLLLFLWTFLWKKRTQKSFGSAIVLKRLSPDLSFFKSALKFVILCLAVSFLVIGLINPKIGTKLETIKREGVDIVFAIDVSKSMLAEDVAPNRLEKSKQLVTQIINNLTSDRVGIIAYAGKAFPQLPITTDYASAKMFLQSMNTDMLSSQGTAINDAIQLSRNYFDDEFGEGFDYAYTYPGMNKVIQAIGRVIRTEEDYGVGILFDDRYSHRIYRTLFPENWNHAKRILPTTYLQSYLDEFWNKNNNNN